MPRRLDVWATPGRAGAAAARVLYQPRHRARIAAGRIARLLPGSSHREFPGLHTQRIVEHIAGIAGIEATATAAVHVRGNDRWLYALTNGEGGVVVKVGKADDAGLAREAAALATLSGCETALLVPVLRWHGEHDGWFVIVTDIVKRRDGPAGAGIEDARLAACALATMNGGFVVHGDLAPWNMIPTAGGLALVDWEKSRFEPDPLCDLAHYVIRSGALLNKWRPRAAVRHLVARDSEGWKYLREIGVEPESAAEHLRRYLTRPTARTLRSSSIRRYEIEMVEILNSNPA